MAYGFVIVTVVVGVEDSVSVELASSPAVSVGDDGVPEVGFTSVVDTRVDRVVVVLVDVREVVVAVVLIAGAYTTGPSRFCELSAVSITAQTSMANSSTAATPET